MSNYSIDMYHLKGFFALRPYEQIILLCFIIVKRNDSWGSTIGGRGAVLSILTRVVKISHTTPPTLALPGSAPSASIQFSSNH